MVNDDLIFLVVDVETTGLSPKSSHIIQIAAKSLGSSRTAIFNEYVLPPKKLTSKIESLTGITDKFLRNGGIDPLSGNFYTGAAKDFNHVYRKFCEFCVREAGDRPMVLIAHNSAFDMRMLNSEIKRLATSFRSNGMDTAKAPLLTRDTPIIASIDTLQLFRDKKLWTFRDHPPTSYRQEDLYKFVFQKGYDCSHNAVADVLALEELLLAEDLSKWKQIADRIVKYIDQFAS